LVASEVRSCLPEVAREPVLGVPAPVVEVGDVRQNETRTVHVPIANNGAGGKDLRVSATPDREWITTASSEIAISAGEVRNLDMTLAPDNRVESGEFAAHISLHSDNAVLQQDAEVELRGRVVEDISLVATPSELNLGQVRISNEPAAATVSFSRSDGRPARPQVIGFEAEDGFAQSVETEAAREAEIRVKLHTANREPATHEGVLVVGDYDPDVSEVRVPVKVMASDVARLRCDQEYELEADDLSGKWEIPLENVGGVPLEVQAMPRASWLKAPRDPLRIEPHSQTNLVLSYYLADVESTLRQATLELRSNDNGHAESVREVRIVAKRRWPKLGVDVDAPGTLRAGRTGRISITLTNTGDGTARVTFGELPWWLSLDQKEVSVAPGSSETVTGLARTESGRAGSYSEAIPIQWNAPPNAEGLLKPEVKVQVVKGGGLGLLVAMLAMTVIIGVIVIIVGPAWFAQLRYRTPLPPPNRAQTPLVVEPEPPSEPEEPRSDTDAGSQLTDDEVKQHLREALRLIRDGKYKQAVLLLEEVLKTDPQNESAHWLLAWAYAHLAQKQDAVRNFEEFIKLSDDPDRVAEARRAVQRLQAEGG